MSEEVKIDQQQFIELNDNLNYISQQLKSIWYLGLLFGSGAMFALYYIMAIL